MRYATVVVRRLLARHIDDWHRRRTEQSADSLRGRQLPLEPRLLLNALVQHVLAAAVASIRFMTVASPPTAGSSRSETRSPRSALPSPGSVPTSPHPSSPGRLPGAHPISPVAQRRAGAAHQPGNPRPGSDRTPFSPVVRALVVWLRPFGPLLTGGARAVAASRQVASSRLAIPVPAFATTDRSSGMRWGAPQRLVGGAVAVLVLVASVVGVSPVHTSAGGTGNVLGAGIGPRIAIGGGSSAGGSSAGGSSAGGSSAGGSGSSSAQDAPVGAPNGSDPGAVDTTIVAAADPGGNLVPADSSVASQDIEAFSDSPGSTPDGVTSLTDALPVIVTDSTNQGPYLADGTILKPIAVDTTAPDARSLLTNYRVRKGDTLTSIAHHFGLSLVTMYWANHLTTNLRTKTDLKVGQVLSVPPVNGVLHIVTDNETLSDISKRTGISVARIVQTNGLKQPTVFVGQWIIVPGAKAKPIPVAAPRPKPVAKPAVRPTASRPTTKPVTRPVIHPTIRPTYTGGGWVWPAPGGHISQYYHYGHWGLDIADDYGAPVVAAKAGIVTFAGWKNNGGGWQVWMSHGNGYYTTYNHMSALTVGTGQSVGAGQQVGRIGMTGHATGPHLHFEVWSGPIWDGGSRLNPLGFI